MTPTPGRNLALFVLCSALLTGCGSAGNPTSTAQLALAPSEAIQANLSAAQQVAVKGAARKMAEDPAAAVHGLRSRSSSGEPRIHVCGYIKTPANDSTPLYVELREADGAVTAERGQIGATPANLAKVRFMCRHHGDW